MAPPPAVARRVTPPGVRFEEEEEEFVGKKEFMCSACGKGFSTAEGQFSVQGMKRVLVVTVSRRVRAAQRPGVRVFRFASRNPSPDVKNQLY